jgi:multiple sugar transport system substrate-binding protein
MRSISLTVALVTLLVVAGGVHAQSPGTASPATSTPPDAGSPPADAGAVLMFSSQLNPVTEQEKMRSAILPGFAGQAEFVGAADTGAFIDRVRAEAQAGTGEVSVLGGLHGEFSTLAADGLLADLSDLAAELTDITPEFTELGRLGGDQQQYIPWMQATYIMAARTEALEHLPEGADINALTWDQLTQWGAALTEATGERLLGFPAGEDGLLHRYFQGYAYPAFTGGVNTTFATPEGVAMWDWLRNTWQYVNPQSTTYGFMQEPLQSGEVWVAWDHTARLIEALRAEPEGMVAFPVPAGPAGRAYMPVVAGLGIPATAPNPDGARALIRYLLQPETQALTLQQVSFFPVIGTPAAVELDAGIQAEQAAVAAQTGASDALPALLPVGLGDQGGAYNQVFRDAFTQIVVDGGDPTAVLTALAPALQGVLDAVSAPCWAPDPPSEGTCQVGNTLAQ